MLLDCTRSLGKPITGGYLMRKRLLLSTGGRRYAAGRGPVSVGFICPEPLRPEQFLQLLGRDRLSNGSDHRAAVKHAPRSRHMRIPTTPAVGKDAVSERAVCLALKATSNERSGSSLLAQLSR
jgi:hypothetical protein